MRAVFGRWAALFVIFGLLNRSGHCLSCTSELQSLDCLPVFTHSPASLSKCYCTSRCPSLDNLRNSCSSGQLQLDPCGICLQCSPGYGEKCGGFANAEGVCSGGLGCLIKYQPGRETEHNKTGTCVTEQGDACSSPKAGVSCRPGQIGVPSDFVFCPSCQKSSMSNRNSDRPLTNFEQPNVNTGFLFSGGQGEGRHVSQTEVGGEGLRPILNGAGTGGGSIVSSILQEIQASIPASIGDSIRENLGRKK